MAKPNRLPGAEKLRTLFAYDPDTGVLVARTGCLAGKVAGSRRVKGGRPSHIAMKVCGRTVSAHRVAWKIHTGKEPPPIIDHINRDPFDNRWCNLRAATPAENSINRRIAAGGSSRFVGVTLHRTTGLWQAQAKHKGQGVYLGLYSCESAAALVRDQWAREVFGDFAVLNFPNDRRAA